MFYLRMTIIFLLAISLHTISANDNQAPESSSFLESLRPYIRQYLGSEMELKILGKTAKLHLISMGKQFFQKFSTQT